MRAQVVLTPTEAKCLISKAIRQDGRGEKGFIPGTDRDSSQQQHLLPGQEITGDVPRTDQWSSARYFRKVFVQRRTHKGNVSRHRSDEPPPKWSADRFPYKWVIKDGKLSSGIPLGKILEEIRADDVYVKGCNALDIEGMPASCSVMTGEAQSRGVMGVHEAKRVSCYSRRRTGKTPSH